MTGYPLKAVLLRRDFARVDAGIDALARPNVNVPGAPAAWVNTVNGPDAVDAIRRLEPDVLVQAGAGILRSPVLELPGLGTLNLHYGIAPLIRGLQSTYWAVLEDRPDWVGSTIHMVDTGIDTGPPLAYYKVADVAGRSCPDLILEQIEGGVRNLAAVLERLQAGERWEISTDGTVGTYRSSVTGWQLLRLQLLRH